MGAHRAASEDAHSGDGRIESSGVRKRRETEMKQCPVCKLILWGGFGRTDMQELQEHVRRSHQPQQARGGFVQ